MYDAGVKIALAGAHFHGVGVTRPGSWNTVDTFKGYFDERDLMRRSARCVHGHGKTGAVRYRHELRSLTSLGLSDAISPLLAVTNAA